MRGEVPTIPDVELRELVLPQNLLTEETLSDSETEEEEERSPYRIDVACDTCSAQLRFWVTATSRGIRVLQELLFSEVSLLCFECSRTRIQDGRL